MKQNASPLVGLLTTVLLWFIVATPFPAQPTYPADCVGVWRFEEGGGTTALDSSGQRHDLYPASRVAVTTQHDNPKLREATLEGGACDFTLKEDLDLLRRTIHQTN